MRRHVATWKYNIIKVLSSQQHANGYFYNSEKTKKSEFFVKFMEMRKHGKWILTDGIHVFQNHAIVQFFTIVRKNMYLT